MKERWKDIPKYEGIYQVSNLGRVKSLPRKYSPNENLIRQHLIGDKHSKYLSVTLSRKGEKVRVFVVHKLVAEAFIGKRPNGFVIDHINDNRLDNKSTNLQYLSNRRNLLKSKKGLNGACLHKGKNGPKKWQSKIRVEGKVMSLGYFESEEDANEAYMLKLSEIEAGNGL